MKHDHPRRTPDLSVVVPLFNEESNVERLHDRLVDSLADLGMSYELVIVDDGSLDATPRLLERLRTSDPSVVVIRLSRNFGHQAAVSAGLDHARGRGVIVMDGDLQDPPEILPRLVARWRQGYDVVYAIRRIDARKTRRSDWAISPSIGSGTRSATSTSRSIAATSA